MYVNRNFFKQLLLLTFCCLRFHGAGEQNKAGVSISGITIYKVAKAAG